MLFFSEISHGISADVFEVIRVAVAFYYLSVKSMDRFLSEKILCDVEDISALVTVFRKFERLILEFVASRLNTDGQIMNLVAGVVVIKLPGDSPALAFEQARQNVTQRTLSCMTQMKRSGRVG